MWLQYCHPFHSQIYLICLQIKVATTYKTEVLNNEQNCEIIKYITTQTQDKHTNIYIHMHNLHGIT